jgi:transposase-like protein
MHPEIMPNLSMERCPNCERFKDSRDFTQPREYLIVARELIDVVNQGAFVMVHATCPLQELFNPQWPGKVVEHGFQCSACGRSYQLSADTYHGRASWEMVETQMEMPMGIEPIAQ